MGLRDIVGALVLIALGDAANKAPLSRLLWASFQDFRGLSAGIPNFAWVIPGGGVFCILIFWAWIIPGGGVAFVAGLLAGT